MRFWLGCSVFLVACASRPSAPPSSASVVTVAPPAPAESQDVRTGLTVLCASRWNGELYGNRFRTRIPAAVSDRITNEDVTKLVISLPSAGERAAMFDAFVAENHISDLPSCPFRDRLASWPPKLPILPGPEPVDEPTTKN